MSINFLLALRASACLALLAALTGCTLTATEVEPDLPTVPVNQANTVAYRLDGQPVVAHNYADFVSAVLVPFLGPFAPGPPVQGQLRTDSVITASCVDDQNIVRPGHVRHGLAWQFLRFRGVGTYRPVPGATKLQRWTRSATDETWLPGPTQSLDRLAPAEVVVTAWNPVTRRLGGTFVLRFETGGTAPAADVRDGRFDLVLSR